VALKTKPKLRLASEPGSADREEGSDFNARRPSTSIPGVATITTSKFNPYTIEPVSPQARSHVSKTREDEYAGRDERPAKNTEDQKEEVHKETAKPEKESASAPSKAMGPKLTETQLFDLYQRLDINGEFKSKVI